MKEKIQLMVEMQAGFQQALNPEWKEQSWPWWRAVYMETAEMIEHTSWKWWKHQEPNLPQAQMELVDIFHFLMNYRIEIQGIDQTAIHLNSYLELMDIDPEENFKLFPELLIGSGERLMASCLEGHIDTGIFVECCIMANLNFDNLFKMYICKNILNQFRQAKGYKQGTYIKNWAIYDSDGFREDNEVLMAMILDWDSPDLLEQINAELGIHYNNVLMYNSKEEKEEN